MAGFLYFLSGQSGAITRERLGSLGLDYILDGAVELQHREASAKSPSGRPGVTFGDARRFDKGQVVGLDLANQTWRQLPKSDVWLGFWNASKPKPEDLERGTMLRGPKLRMADGEQWQIPIVRNYDEESNQYRSALPAYLDYDANGNVCRGEPLAEYRELWDKTAPLASQQFEIDSQGEGQLDDSALYTAVVALLQANYVVALPELVMLQTLADNDSMALIALTSCRYDALVKWMEATQKKSEPLAASSG